MTISFRQRDIAQGSTGGRFATHEPPAERSNEGEERGYEPIDGRQLAMLFNAFRDRYREWDFRKRKMDDVIAGDWSEVDPANEKLISRSPNLIQVALEDTAEAAGTMPTIRVIPRKATQTLKKKSARMEKIAMGYMDNSIMELKLMETVMDMAAFGAACWVVWPNFDTGLPEIERRDPRFFYPEPGYRPNQKVRRCMFARQLHFSQLPSKYQDAVLPFVTDDNGDYLQERLKIMIVEFFTEHEYVVAAMFQGNERDPLNYPGYGIAPAPCTRRRSSTGGRTRRACAPSSSARGSPSTVSSVGSSIRRSASWPHTCA